MKASHSDVLESLQVSMGLLRAMDTIHNKPSATPIWKMVYNKAADQVEWIFATDFLLWSEEETKYLSDIHEELIIMGIEAKNETQ
jgi:hypothetical protein